MSYIDFETIKKENPIMDVAERLGLDMKKSNQQFRGKCPVCEGGGGRGLVITPDKKVFYCFSDKKGGDAIQLVAHINQIGVKDAASWIAGEEQPIKRDNEPKEKKPTKAPPSEGKGFRELDYLQHDHPAVEAVGFSQDDAEQIGVGYAPRGMMRGQVAVPVRDATGKLLGYLGVSEAVLPSSWRF